MRKKAKREVTNIAYTVMSYIICAYTVFATIVNILNMMEIPFFPELMKPTFWGSSLLSLLVVLYELIQATQNNEILKKIRPYIMGILIADIVSACRFPLCLVLLLVLGYFMISDFQKLYDTQKAALTFLTACIGIEVYSVIYLLLENVSNNSIHSFLQSVGPDALFVLSAIVYGTAANSLAPKADVASASVSESNGFAYKKIVQKLKAICKWFPANSTRIGQYVGYGICIISIALFFYYTLSVEISTRKVEASTEALYVLKHCGDPTLALTAIETEDPTVFKVSFERYEGKNNQKIYFAEISKNIYHLFFHEPTCTLETSENGELYATSENISSPQEWIGEIYEDEITVIRLLAMSETPLRYSLSDNSNTQFIVSAESNSEDSECFIMKRTIADEFITRMASNYFAEFKPTILMETIFVLFGKWTWLLFIILVLVIFSIIYSRRFIGDKFAALAITLLLYALAYESVYTFTLFYATFGVRCYYCYRIHNLQKRDI